MPSYALGREGGHTHFTEDTADRPDIDRLGVFLEGYYISSDPLQPQNQASSIASINTYEPMPPFYSLSRISPSPPSSYSCWLFS